VTPDRGLDTEIETPKYAHLELERRWLVDHAARPSAKHMAFTLIEDRYIVGTRLRLRRMTADGRTVCKITKKYETARAEARPIVTAYLTEDEYTVFAALPALAMRKRRFRFPHDGRDWSLDVFEGALTGLQLVEAEAEHEAALAALVPPPWAAKEVTHDARFQCGALAQTNAIPE
jgi:CYTH domain-containing protein